MKALFVQSKEALSNIKEIYQKVLDGNIVYLSRPSGVSVMRLRPAEDDWELDDYRTMTPKRLKSILDRQQKFPEIISKKFAVVSSRVSGIERDIVIEPVMPGIDKRGREVHPTHVRIPGTRFQSQRDVWWDLVRDGKVSIEMVRNKTAEYVLFPLQNFSGTPDKEYTLTDIYKHALGQMHDIAEGETALVKNKSRKIDKSYDVGLFCYLTEETIGVESEGKPVEVETHKSVEPETDEPEQVDDSEGLPNEDGWKIGDRSVRPSGEESPFAEEVEIISVSKEGVSRVFVVHNVITEDDTPTRTYMGERVVFSDSPPENWKKQELTDGNNIWLPCR